MTVHHACRAEMIAMGLPVLARCGKCGTSGLGLGNYCPLSMTTFVPKPPPSQEVVRGNYPRPDIPNGTYEHYKGGRYDVFGLASKEDTGDWVVLYRNPHTMGQFVCLASEWSRQVGDATNCKPRFSRVTP